jgi:hypothetical protein
MPIRPFSQPSSLSGEAHSSDPSQGVNAFKARELEVLASEVKRLERSRRLDRFLNLVKGACPVHFVTTGQLLKGHSSIELCQLDSAGTTFPLSDFRAFKKKFCYKAFCYCFHCGSPQDHKGNGEALPCHRKAGFGHKLCPWADFPYAVVFSIWHVEDVRREMMANFQMEEAATPYDRFKAWCTEEHSDRGEYTKMLEVFVWYCEKVLA